jgi:hypothetical protein
MIPRRQAGGREDQSPLGKTHQLRRTLAKIGMIERMAGVEASFYRERTRFVCKINAAKALVTESSVQWHEDDRRKIPRFA